MSDSAPADPCDSLATTAHRVAGSGVGPDYTASLLEWLGSSVVRSPSRSEPDPAIEWAGSGAMALTGHADGPPLLAPGPLATCARAVVDAIRLVAGERWSSDLDGPLGQGLTLDAQLSNDGRDIVTHLITATATASGGGTGAVTLLVLVQVPSN